MKLFVTGGTGFIGAHFINSAIDDGHDIIALQRESGRKRIKSKSEPKWIYGNLDGDYGEVFQECDMLVHLASAGVSPQPTTWSECLKENVLNSMLLCEKAVNHGIKKIVVSGTALEYGISASRYYKIPPNAPLEPIGAYASSKAAFFELIHGMAIERNISLSYLRLFTVYGEGQFENNLWPSLYKAAVLGNDFKMTMGEQVRDFISVEDVAREILKIVNSDDFDYERPRVMNIGTGDARTVLEFAEYWWKKWNATGKLLPGSIPYREGEVMNVLPLITCEDI